MHSSLVFGASRGFRQFMDTVDEYAASPWPILILGETGVGKELIARRIHEKSSLRAQVFLPVNCGAIPGSLFESELFGYERGAFSGAIQNHRGLIRTANGGSLFLDEVGELDLGVQSKLLRWLDSGEIRAVGSTRLERTSVRLIAATHVDLPSAVAEKSFRLDLLCRLSVLVLRVPPLRERPEDIVLIAENFLDEHQVNHSPEDLEPLMGFPWPGNIRQLRNLLLRAVARGTNRLSCRLIQDLLCEEAQMGYSIQKEPLEELLESPLAAVEKRVIMDRIHRCNGNKKQAAKELGIAKSTLHEKLRRWTQPARTGLRLDSRPIAL